MIGFGYEAGRCSQGVSSCPYPAKSEEEKRWVIGWYLASNLHIYNYDQYKYTIDELIEKIKEKYKNDPNFCYICKSKIKIPYDNYYNKYRAGEEIDGIIMKTLWSQYIKIDN